MLSSVLNSEQVIEVNIAIMRTFVRVRQANWFQNALLTGLHAPGEKMLDRADLRGLCCWCPTPFTS